MRSFSRPFRDLGDVKFLVPTLKRWAILSLSPSGRHRPANFKMRQADRDFFVSRPTMRKRSCWLLARAAQEQGSLRGARRRQVLDPAYKPKIAFVKKKAKALGMKVIPIIDETSLAE